MDRNGSAKKDRNGPIKPLSRWRWQGGFEKIWSGIVSRKLRGGSHLALKEGYRAALLGLGRFNDFDFDTKLLTGELTKEDLRAILDSYAQWLMEFELGADHVFMQTESEQSASEVYRRPLQFLRELLLDLSDGDDNAWSVLRRDRKQYHRRYLEFRCRAKQTYNFLMSIGASREEAINAVNEKILKAKLFHVNAAPERDRPLVDPNAFGSVLTLEMLKGLRKVAPISEEVGAQALETASKNTSVVFPGCLKRLQREPKDAFISSIVLFLLSGHIDQLSRSRPIPSTMDNAEASSLKNTK